MGHRPAVYNDQGAPCESATFAELVDGWRHWEERWSTPFHVVFVDIGVELSTHGGTEDELGDDHEYGEPVLDSVMLFPEGYFSQDDDYKETLLR